MKMKKIEEQIEDDSKVTTLNSKVARALKNFQALYNKDAKKILKNAIQEKGAEKK